MKLEIKNIEKCEYIGVKLIKLRIYCITNKNEKIKITNIYIYRLTGTETILCGFSCGESFLIENKDYKDKKELLDRIIDYILYEYDYLIYENDNFEINDIQKIIFELE